MTKQRSIGVWAAWGLLACASACASGGEALITPGANGVAGSQGIATAGSGSQMMVAMNAGSGATPPMMVGNNMMPNNMMGGVAGSGMMNGMPGPIDDPNDGNTAAGSNGGVAGSTAPVDDGEGQVTDGACCADGDCLCHGADPSARTSRNGEYSVESFAGATGTIYYPTDAEPPFAGVAICAGFLNTGVEMLGWGEFYASHGIVTNVVTTLPSDIPAIRASLLLGGIEELKSENTKSGGPLSGKMAGRYGTSGYSMGGGGTTIASGTDKTLRTSVGLAAWGGDGSGVTTPTLLLCGDADTVAPCYMSDGVYATIAESVPKMQVVAPGASHFAWFGPGDAASGMSGEYALAFQKVFLEGDERWKPLLLEPPGGLGGSMVTSIK